MKTLITSLFVLFAVMSTGCGWTYVDPGEAGIKVNLWGSDKGVEDSPVFTGGTIYNPFTTRIYTYPTSMHRYPWTKDATEGSPTDEKIEFSAKNSVKADVDVAIALHFDQAKIPQAFKFFRVDADQVVRGWVRDRVREAFTQIGPHYEAMELRSEKLTEFQNKVTDRVREELSVHGISLDNLTLISIVRFDPTIEQSVTAAIARTQEAIAEENKVRVHKAVAEQKVADAFGEGESKRQRAQGEAEAIKLVADANAYANQKLAESYTDRLLNARWIEKWNGAPPYFMAGESTSFMLPMK